MGIKELVNTGKSESQIELISIGFNEPLIVTDEYLVYTQESGLMSGTQAVLKINKDGEIEAKYQADSILNENGVMALRFHNPSNFKHTCIIAAKEKTLWDGTVQNSKAYMVESDIVFIKEHYGCYLVTGFSNQHINESEALIFSPETGKAEFMGRLKEPIATATASVARIQLLTENNEIYGITSTGAVVKQAHGTFWERVDGKPLYPDDDCD